MAKIIEVVNAMITNQEKITNVIKNDDEYYFLYNKKYKWSTKKEDDENYYIYFYPDPNKSLDDLTNITDWQGYGNYVSYTTADLKTQEAEETFRELFQIVSDKLYGIDKIFDDIINN